MSFTINNINLLNEVIDLRFQLFRTQILIDVLARKSGNFITTEEMKASEDKAYQLLKNKYPNININKTS